MRWKAGPKLDQPALRMVLLIVHQVWIIVCLQILAQCGPAQALMFPSAPGLEAEASSGAAGEKDAGESLINFSIIS